MTNPVYSTRYCHCDPKGIHHIEVVRGQEFCSFEPRIGIPRQKTVPVMVILLAEVEIRFHL